MQTQGWKHKKTQVTCWYNQQVKLWGHRVNFEIDSGANESLCSKETWVEIGKPKLQPVESQYKVADGSPLQALGQFEATAKLGGEAEGVKTLKRWSSPGCLNQTCMVDKPWWNSDSWI